MFTHETNRKWIAMFIVAGLIFGIAACYASANEGHTEHQRSQVGHNHAGHDEASHKAHHGGQLSETKAYCFEVVYWPKETRIYLHDHDQRHLSMKGVRGEAAMQIRGADQVVRFPAHYVTTRNPGEHDFLAVAADVSQVRDGEMRVTFALANLPNTAERAVRFAQTFALSRSDLTVTVAALTAADSAGVGRQAVCPVMGTRLGEHGTPVKLLIGDQPLYVCCKDCIAKVRKEPQAYLSKAALRDN